VRVDLCRTELGAHQVDTAQTFGWRSSIEAGRQCINVIGRVLPFSHAHQEGVEGAGMILAVVVAEYDGVVWAEHFREHGRFKDQPVVVGRVVKNGAQLEEVARQYQTYPTEWGVRPRADPSTETVHLFKERCGQHADLIDDDRCRRADPIDRRSVLAHTAQEDVEWSGSGADPEEGVDGYAPDIERGHAGGGCDDGGFPEDLGNEE